MKINNRLKVIGDLVPLSSYPLDIGCDHALLSIYLVKEKGIKKAVASDNKSGPLEKASSNVNFYNVQDKVKLIKAEGLDSYCDGINTITISGMGGLSINKILENNKKYLRKNNIKAMRKTGINMNDLFEKKERNEIEEQLILQYNKFQPTLKNRCVMNELCSFIERADFDLKYFKKKDEKKFDYKKLLSEDYIVRPRSVLYERVDNLIKKYKGKLQDMSFSTSLLVSSDMSKKDIEDFIQEISFVNHLYFLEKDIERIGINTAEVYNYFVEIIYSKYKQGYNILWDIFYDDILEMLNKGKMYIPVENENGDVIYFGKRYSLVEVDIDDNI